MGTEESGPLQFKYPYGIAYSTNSNKVYVADRENCRIQVLNSDLTFSSTFGSYGTGKGQLYYPYGIDFDSTGKVYVADTNNYRIQVFTPEGDFSRIFGVGGQQEALHYGIAIDINDSVYVSELANGKVSVFTSEGQFTTSFGWGKERPGKFLDPRGVAVDNSGVVYVCNSNCVHLF